MTTITPGNTYNPEIETQIFTKRPEPYWVSRISGAENIDRDKIFEASARLRGNVYLNLHYVSPEQVDEKGREIDRDDLRSIHFSVLERAENGSGERSRVIGTSRLILKDSEHNKLPIEKYFPELFESSPAALGTVEVSRLISQHENPRIQHLTAMALIRAMTHFSIDRNIGADYCMVEEGLLRFLNSQAIPTEILGQPKEVEEQGGVLYPVKIEPAKVLINVTSSELGKTALKQFFLNGIANLGEDYYEEGFLRA